MSTAMAFDGERFTPECVREMWYEHYSRYAFAAQFAHGKRVLDCACGEGYGSAILASHAATVQGCDVSEAAVAHARLDYARSNLVFTQANALALPFPDASFDLLVSFETLEHLHEHAALLAEFRRVLAPDGVLMISTPDKLIYSDLSGQQNPFHVRELYRHQFEQLLAAHFPFQRIYGHKLLFQSVIFDLTQCMRASAHTMHESELQPGLGYAPTYLIAIASMREAALRPFVGLMHLFGESAETLYRHYEAEIRNGIYAAERIKALENELAQLRQSHAP